MIYLWCRIYSFLVYSLFCRIMCKLYIVIGRLQILVNAYPPKNNVKKDNIKIYKNVAHAVDFFRPSQHIIINWFVSTEWCVGYIHPCSINKVDRRNIRSFSWARLRHFPSNMFYIVTYWWFDNVSWYYYENFRFHYI